MVGHHAPGPARRHVDAQRMGPWQGRDLRHRRRLPRCRARRTSSRPTSPIAIARTGQTVTRTGRSVVYTGYQWRGRSTRGRRQDTALREVMFVDRDWRQMEGRWFMGGYDEVGLDVRLERAGSEPRLLGTDRTALRAGATGQELKIYGANLPAALRAADVDLGPGLTVARVASVTPDVATVVVDVASGAAVGARDLFVAGCVEAESARRVRSHRHHQGEARLGDGPRRRRHFPENAGAVRSVGIPQRRRRPRPTPPTTSTSAWSTPRGAWKSTPPPTMTTTSSSSARWMRRPDGSRRTWTARTRVRKGSRNNVGDVWVVAKYTPEPAAGKPASTMQGARAPAGDGAALHALRSDRGVGPMSLLGLREFHSFEAAGRRFVYLVPSAAVFALDDCSEAVMKELGGGPRAAADLTRRSVRAVRPGPRCQTRSPSCNACAWSAMMTSQRFVAIADAEDRAAAPRAPADARRQRDQPVQPGLHVLLRVRRRQDRRHRKRRSSRSS